MPMWDTLKYTDQDTRQGGQLKNFESTGMGK
jgi:hypothetical protein